MRRLFVTGTGTDIGKTFVSAAIAHAASRGGVATRVFKPVASGFSEDNLSNSDPGILIEAIGEQVTAASVEAIAPWRYAKPVAPYLAAAGEGREVPYGAVVDYSREILRRPEKLVMIEGIGGVMAPVDRLHTVLDWIGALAIPAILVAGTYVGTISHTLSALGVLRAAGIRVFAIVLNESRGSPVSAAEQAAAIGMFAGGVPIYTLPYVEGERAWARVPCASLVEAILHKGVCANL
jgi:dethiobiotin synthetase